MKKIFNIIGNIILIILTIIIELIMIILGSIWTIIKYGLISIVNGIIYIVNFIRNDNLDYVENVSNRFQIVRAVMKKSFKNMQIKRQSFELAKNRLKEFSEIETAVLEIGNVKTQDIFFSHKVTGEELNDKIKIIQDYIIDLNIKNNNVINEFGEIYNTFEALDKEYIASILTTIESVEKTSNDVRIQQDTLKEHNDKLEMQQNKLDAHQIEIEKSIDNISKIITALHKYKEKMDSYDSFEEIDKIYSDYKAMLNVIEEQKKHLQDIEMNNAENTGKLDSLYFLINEEEQITEDATKKYNTIEYLEKKTKYAYLISGGAIGCAIIGLVLILTK